MNHNTMFYAIFVKNFSYLNVFILNITFSLLLYNCILGFSFYTALININ